MFEKDLALNNLQRLICHKTNPKPNLSSIDFLSGTASFRRNLKQYEKLSPQQLQIHQSLNVSPADAQYAPVQFTIITDYIYKKL